MAKKRFNIGLHLGLNERFDHRVAIGIIKYARTRDDFRLFGNEWLTQTGFGDRENRPDGVIARFTNRDELRPLKADRVPVVDIAGSFNDSCLAQSVNDDRFTGAMAGKHLLSCGFRHFAYVGLSDMLWSSERLLGFGTVVKEHHGVDIQPYIVGHSWLKRSRSLTGLVKWLKKLPLPCGIMAANDLIGYRVSAAAALAGLSVPDQLAIIGVDNEEVYCELAMPRLTSITCDCEKIGYEAASLLHEILVGNTDRNRIVIAPLQVEPRDSTNIVIGEDSLVREIKRYINTHVGKGINVADVALHFPMSRRALEKRFKASEGKTIHEAIMSARLRQSCKLLAAGKTATEAGYESGFAAVQYFCQAFKKHYGMTPMSYSAACRR